MPDPADTNLDEVRRRARRRLIGAIVLALAAAVLVPLLLESDPKPLGEDVSVRIPPVDAGKFVNRLSDAKGKVDPRARPAPAPAKDAASGDAAKDGSTKSIEQRDGADATLASRRSLTEVEQRVLAPTAKSATKSEAAPPPAKPVPDPIAPSENKPQSEPKAAPVPDAKSVTPAEPKATPAAEAKPAAVPAAAPANGGTFSVQLAAYSDDKGANALAGRLARAGHTAYVEPYETSRGTLWRVRVGPFPSREAAGAARDQLKAEGQNGIVTPSK